MQVEFFQRRRNLARKKTIKEEGEGGGGAKTILAEPARTIRVFQPSRTGRDHSLQLEDGNDPRARYGS